MMNLDLKIAPRNGPTNPFSSRVFTLEWMLIAIILLQGVNAFVPSLSRPLEVSTFAPWPTFAHSLLLETAEFLADEDSSGRLFWRYVNSIVAETASDSGIDKEMHATSVVQNATTATDMAFRISRSLVAPLTHDVLRMAVSSRAYSPAVELQRTLGMASLGASQCIGSTAWAEFSSGMVACDAPSFRVAVKHSDVASQGVFRLDTLETDHWYVPESPAATLAAVSKPLVIIYGSLGDASTAALHTAAATAADAGMLRYILRLFPGHEETAYSSQTWLAGYGVGLDIKSTEYKVTDERRKQSDGRDSDFEGNHGTLEGMAEILRTSLRTVESDTSLPPSWRLDIMASQAARYYNVSKNIFPGADESAEGQVSMSARNALLFGDTTVATAVSHRLQVLNHVSNNGDAVHTDAPSMSATLHPLREDREAQESANKAILGSQAVAWVMAGNNAETTAHADSFASSSSSFASSSASSMAFSVDAAGNVVSATSSSSSGGENDFTVRFGGGGDPLQRLVTLTTNFPSMVPFLSTLLVSPELQAEINTNAPRVPPGAALMSVNGISVEPSSPQFNVFALLNVLRQEAHVVASLDALPLTLADRRRVANLAVAGSKEAMEAEAAASGNSEAPAEGSNGGNAMKQLIRVDVLVDPTRDWIHSVLPLCSAPSSSSQSLKRPYPIVTWAVDLESAEQPPSRARWPTSLGTLLQPSWQLHTLRRNLYNTLLIGDLATPSSLKSIATVAYFMQMGVPVTFGYLPTAGTTPSEIAALEKVGTTDAEAGSTPNTCVDSFRIAERSWDPSDNAVGLDIALLHAAIVTQRGTAAAKVFFERISLEWRELMEIKRAEAAKAAGLTPEQVQMQMQGMPGGGPPLVVPEPPLPLSACIDAYATAALTAAQSAEDAKHGSANEDSVTDEALLDMDEDERANLLAREAGNALTDATGAMRQLVLAAGSWVRERGLPTTALIVNGRVGPSSAAAVGGSAATTKGGSAGASSNAGSGSGSTPSGASPSSGAASGIIDVQADLMRLVSEDLQLLQRAVANNLVDDSVAPSVYAAMLGHGTTLVGSQSSRRRRTGTSSSETTSGYENPRIPGFTNIVARFDAAIFASEDLHAFLPLSAPEAAPLVRALHYVHAPGTYDDVKPVSLSLLDDLSSNAGLSAAAALLELLHVPSGEEATESVDNSNAGVSALVRVGIANIPPLAVDGSASNTQRDNNGIAISSLGDAVAAVWALITGACNEPSLDSTSPFQYLRVRPDAQAPLLRAVIRLAMAHVGNDNSVANTQTSSAFTFLRQLESAATRGAQRDDSSNLRSVWQRLGPAISILAQNASGTNGDQPALPVCVERVLHAAKASHDVARQLIPNALPEAQHEGSNGQTNIRALIVNGRVLALSALPENASCVSFTLTNAPTATTADRSSGQTLPACLSPTLAAVAAKTEADARGTGIVRMLASVTSYPGVDADDATAEWVTGIVMAAAATVGSSLSVASGAVGGRSMGRTALRTQVLHTEYTSFTVSPPSRTSNTDAANSNAESVGFAVTAIVDPVSEDAARVTTLLALLRDRLGATVTVHMTPPREAPMESMPLKSFYRFVAPTEYYDSTDPRRNAMRDSHTTATDWTRPTAAFAWLPKSPVLTLKHYVPESWNTQTAVAEVDLDNLRIGDLIETRLQPPIAVQYKLKDVLAAGQCLDITGGGNAFPNGLQLTLQRHSMSKYGADAVTTPATNAVVSDTLVMQNLGYWQLKAAPGVFRLAIAEGGRAAELFNIMLPATSVPASAIININKTSNDDDNNNNADEVDSAVPAITSGESNAGYSYFFRRSSSRESAVVPVRGLRVTIRDFTGAITQLTVAKKPGMESETLLQTEADKNAGKNADGKDKTKQKSGLFAKLTRSLFGSNDNSQQGTQPTDTGSNDNTTLSVIDTRPQLHVFSLASGHLYERFLKIMMISAVKRTTSHRIKFWLLENTLSPAFKSSVPALTEKFGFEVAYVTYKWPNWLRQQTEKQRIIWGYKILFLDVLFPLNLTKVIYVDSDQILRADLGELWEHDLQGAPYAYTPFCTSRHETLGYQFWRQGYWADHLQGRPYHISALYVVDLAAFRRGAVGDTLRAIYDQLSRDPNSLSNLDQDLPNYAQSAVPIHSLPQEWLWCESWCSDESLASAKTIDLCNNPRYKEPKLDMARRIISGKPMFNESWDELDREVSTTVDAYLAIHREASSN